MTLYIDTKLHFLDANITTVASWHSSLPLLAVGSYNQEKGGFVTIFQESGLPLEGCDWPTLLSNQVTALEWHPTRRLLVVGWDGGELYIWLEYSWARLEAPHSAALTTIKFSVGGGRLLASDVNGSLSGWQSNSGAPLTSFHHQLGDIITHIAFCAPRASGEASIRSLARAAIAGDENALDALAAWRPRTTARLREGTQPDNHACYAAQDNGILMYIDHTGACSEVLNAPGNIVFLKVVSNHYLLTAWESAGALSLTRFVISEDGSLTTDSHVRMTVRNGQSVVLVGNFSISVITGDAVIRIWDSENGENDVLPDEKEITVEGDIFTSLAYCNLTDTLCCGTSQGNLYLWRRDHRNKWKLISRSSVRGTIKEVSWGSEGLMNPLLYVNCITSAYILREQPVSWGSSNNVTMVQKSSNEIAISDLSGLASTINTTITIRAFAYKDRYVAVGDGKDVQVWQCSEEYNIKFSLMHKFSWKTDILIIHEDILVGVVTPHIECRTVSGNQLGILLSSENEGEPIGITNTHSYIVIATMDGSLKLAEITKKGLKMPYPVKNCYQVIEDFGEVMRAAVNSAGKFICLSVANAGLAPDPRLYLWDAANDTVTNKNLPGNMSPPYQSVPVSIVWDTEDPRLLAVQFRSAECDHIHLYFCHEGTLYEYKNWNTNGSNDLMTEYTLCTLCAPNVVILMQQNLKRILMSEFKDITNLDAAILKQMLDFLYKMSIGQLEKAVVTGTNLGNGKKSMIWNSLAKECVIGLRPDVGAVCLSKMGNIKGALMMRKVMNNPNYDDLSKVGVLAVNLGLLEQAESLFKKAERPDLVTRLISAKEGGLSMIANSSDEGENLLLLRTAQHKLAKATWSSGETSLAINLFEKAGTHVPHVPRLLVQQGQINALSQYAWNSKEPELIMWWGHYLESIGDLDNALEAYKRAEDYGEQTRLLCHMERITEAEVIYNKTPAAMYQMARYWEMQPDKTEEAVKLYLKCGVTSAAIRVATEARDWPLVWRAGAASPQHALYAAYVLENAGQTEQAISLYQKTGKHHIVLKLALENGDTNSIIAAVEALGSSVEPELAQKLAAHLRAHDHHSHAAALLATTGQYDEALNIVEKESTPLTEELGEKLAAPAGVPAREALLRRLADVLGARGLYHQAAKRLAQAGDKAGALRWLMRSDDADRVATFAAAARDSNVQLMAAEYLRRHAAWRSRPDLTRHIIHFYTRAKAHSKLAGFYAECAKLEVDEYDNYEKALEALKESIHCLSKATDSDTGAQAIALQQQSTLVKRYLDVKKLLEAGDINTGVTSAEQLLRALEARSGLVSEERVLKLLLQYAFEHANAPVFEEQLRLLQRSKVDEDQPPNSPDQSIEEEI